MSTAQTDELTIDIKALVSFFDEKPPKSVHHATAICQVAGEELGVALFKHYIEGNGKKANILTDRCTHGKKKGHRLDYWVLTEREDDRVLYQVEVKNWSAHAIGGKTLPLTIEPIRLSEYMRERWSKEWQNGTFIKHQVRKVLERMKPPEITYTYKCIEPLVCFWTALHPEGKNEPFFAVQVLHADFSTVNIFSMSTFLRRLLEKGETHLRLFMPVTRARLDWLELFFS